MADRRLDATAEARTTTAASTEPAEMSAAGSVPLGSRIGRYQIERCVGVGGMGEVYAALDIELGRMLALKFVRPAGSVGVDRIRVQREAQALARLSHPGVVSVYDIGSDGDRLFLAMELLEGGTLRSWLCEPRPWRAIVDRFAQAGRALAAAHRAGVVHRDFKPENVLLGGDDELRVADFGLARTLDEREVMAPAAIARSVPPAVTREGAVIGTPAYMAPEQLLGGAVTARTDQFSFCVALYEALCGVRPYEPEVEGVASLAQRSEAMTGGRLRTPSRPVDAPRWLQAIVARGLRVRAEDRWPSMDALLAAIEQEQRRRRLRWLAIGGVALVAVAVAVATLLVRPTTSAAAPRLTLTRLDRWHRGNDWVFTSISGDGRTLGNVSQGGDRAWLEDFETHARRDLALPPGDTPFGPLGLDGDGVALALGEHGLWRLDLHSGVWSRVTPLGKGYRGHAIARDGRLIALIDDDELVVRTAERVVRGKPLPPNTQWEVGAVDGDGRVLIRDDNDVVVLDRNLEIDRRITMPPAEHLRSFTWASRRYLLVLTVTLGRVGRLYEVGPLGQPGETWRLLQDIDQETPGVMTLTDRGVFITGNGNDRTAWWVDLGELDSMDALRPLPTGGVSDQHVRGWASNDTVLMDVVSAGKIHPALVSTDDPRRTLSVSDDNSDALALDEHRVSAVKRAAGTCTLETTARGDAGAPWVRATTLPSCFDPSDVICTDGLRTPCLIAEHVEAHTHWRRFDPFSGLVGAEVFSAETEYQESVALSASGRLAVTRSDRPYIVIVDPATHQQRTLPLPANTAPQFTAWSHDETFLIVAGMRALRHYDYALLFVDIASGFTRVLVNSDTDWFAEPRLSAGDRLAVLRWAITPTTWLLEGYRPPP